MRVTRDHVSSATPMGANLVAGGATFRVWAPRAKRVHVVGAFGGENHWEPNPENLLERDAEGYWTGFVAAVRDGDPYKFYVAGEAHESYKRDPYARELSSTPAYPHCDCLVRDRTSYAWRDQGWRPPAFNDLILYQLHVGTFTTIEAGGSAHCFLDILQRLDHLVRLGVNAVQLLPVVEFSSPRSLGYDGSDIFSPEMDYTLEGDAVDPYLPRVAALFARCGKTAPTKAQLAVPINQLKALIDLFHLHGIAVFLDVVYNHAGHQIIGQEESIWFFDWASGPDPNQSLYFTDRTHTGPVFAVWKREVRQFLIDNAGFFLDEYHVDGLRFDQVSVILQENQGSGWVFCVDCTSTQRTRKPEAPGVAEHWPVEPFVVSPVQQGGLGFDATWSDGLRTAARAALEAASFGSAAHVPMERIAQAMDRPGWPERWRAVQYLESHDEVYRDRAQRIARLCDANDPRSWYARSRARMATALLLCAPGIPMLFMGQEFLEDKQWSDDPGGDSRYLLYWRGVEGEDRNMVDFLRFVTDAVHLRRAHPALRGEGLRIITVDSFNRVLAFQRWVEGAGGDVVVIASLNESPLYDYRLGFPHAGEWSEIFNSDVYDCYPNPHPVGNGGRIVASESALHGLQASAALAIPANGVLVVEGPRDR